MSADLLFVLSLALLAIALLLIASVLLVKSRAEGRAERLIVRTVARRAEQRQREGGGSVEGPLPYGLKGQLDRLIKLAGQRLDSRLGRALVAAEDQRLIELCGFVDIRSRAVFLCARLLSALLVPLLWLAMLGHGLHGVRFWMWLFVVFAIGFMLPKWFLVRFGNQRKAGAAEELPLFVDLLRLLQGVGLGIDQSLMVISADFRTILPVLARELEIANRQFATGRSREQSFQRLATIFQNDDLVAITRLILQVDRYGGAVQEPLRQFGERLRENRRSNMKERIGKLTVKMTAVMVSTLLPALLIVTAGPGFLAVIRSLARLGGRG
ncbi:type II secretion system F family protein [Crenobacter sp. SG2303]|uniref:Type II secretion system F family protein n=1 Tax=Crenobacter oryzisoli TaxID=3056844 RepID=A0ABT7XTQ5_9NEIS|nr:type II secretion system F family protein [Crenobacter sp. SG2303]MDN0077108.1 type II secretion system F family protein [Crenobacter sp. SG2303]